MALVVADKVKVRTYSTGTGTITLETVIPGFQSFAAVGSGNECYYGIEDSAGNWEVGRGTYTDSGGTESLSRDVIYSSSNSNFPVNFQEGGKTVFCTIPSNLLNNIVSGAVSDSFKTIAISGQTSVVADSSTDTLTLVEGPGITITTDHLTDTITFEASNAVPAAISQNGYEVSIDTLGNVNYPGDIKQSYQDATTCLAGVDTVIYTATGQYQHALKLFVMVEGTPDGGSVWETQACDLIAVRGYTNNTIHITAYGITYSSAAAFATFDGRWNSITNRLEITCRPTSLTNSVVASVQAFEMSSND